MTQMIGYKIFDSEDAFVAWQKEKERIIFVVSPMVMTVNGNVDGAGAVQAKTVIGCFVTYRVDA